jgi:hypothetical protein
VSWFEKLLLALFPHFDITKEVEDGRQSVYLRRFYLVKSRWFNIFVHHIMRSDDDPDPHDHPWWFFTLVLRGGYYDEQWRWEPTYMVPIVDTFAETPDAAKRIIRSDWSPDWYGSRTFRRYALVRAGSVRFRSAHHVHRVILRQNMPSWSLVVAGPTRREWGFVRAGKWVWWRRYLGVWGDDHA